MTRLGKTALIEQFRADGFRYLFGNPGTVEEGLLDELGRVDDLEYVLALQESVAVAIADGYARGTGGPALVQLHSGVGLGNGIGMLYQALRGHTPLVVIAGEAGVQYEAMDAQMAVDLVAMARPVTKYATRVSDPSSVLRTLRRAVKIAMTPPRGPVFVSLPLDVLDAPNDEPVLPTPIPQTRVVPTPDLVAQAAGLRAGGAPPLGLWGDGGAAARGGWAGRSPPRAPAATSAGTATAAKIAPSGSSRRASSPTRNEPAMPPKRPSPSIQATPVARPRVG